jgi:YVTN family beta-propeller protein
MADIKAVADIRIAKCLTKDEIAKTTDGKGLVLNSDGTVSVYYNNPDLGLYPVQLTLECCKLLDPTYTFDINTQTCRWGKPKNTCGFSEPINLIINPKENDGTLFFIDDFQKEKCDLKISFDYLLKIKCEDLLNIANPTVVTYLREETKTTIVKTQMEIESINADIETLTSEIVKLNEEYLGTPYSLECAQFPVVITTPDPVNCQVSAWSPFSTCVNGFQTQTRTIITQPANGGTPCPVLTQTQSCTVVETTCVRPTTTRINIYTTINGVNITNSATLACAAAAGNISSNSGQSVEVTNLVDGGYMYAINGTNDCTFFSNGFYVVFIGATRKAIQITNGVITILNCTIDTSRTTTTTKAAAFDKSGFSEMATDLTANLDVYQKGSTTTYIYVNYCLTDLGLQVWEGILNASGGSYQGFILGNPNSYTCADVIALANQKNAADLFRDCKVPFGTKSEILVQINELMSQLNTLQTQLTTLNGELVILRETFEIQSTSTKGCTSMIDALESLDVEMHLDIVNADNSLTSVFSAATFQAIDSTTNLYDYLINNPNSGFYICGDPSKDNVGLSNCTTLSLDEDVEPNVDSCNSIVEDLIDALSSVPGADINNIPYNAFASQWLTYSTVISDPKIIGLITNKKIKISFKINFSCVDFCLLLDNLVLDKSCRSVDRNDITISQNPGFDLQRVIDNKKSWIDNTSPTNREFLISKSNGNNPIRQTDYDVNDERLVINSKEIDLDICVASAIETDVWCYLNDNPCALTDECTSTIASTDNNPYIDGQTIVFSGTPITIADCTDYNGILANTMAEFIQTTECGTILRFKFKTTAGFPPALIVYYYWLVQQPNGDVEFYFQNSTTFTNLSNVYQNGRECCEYLNIDLKTYNKAASQPDDFEVYWDEDCQRCKVQKAKCGDVNLNLHTLVTEPISGVTTVEQFENLMTGQFIDAKNRQTISSYPTLRAIYERYLNSSEHCSTVSSAFDYQNMDRFSNLIGNYWIDLIEQVVPSTTIWGSVKIYTNTIFDEQKFKYKSYSTLLCNNPFIGEHVLSPINGVNGLSQGVNVISTDLRGSKKDTPDWYTSNSAGELVLLPASERPTQAIPSGIVLDEIRPRPRIKNPVKVCNNMYIAQMNSGSEFISYFNIPQPIIVDPEEPVPCVYCTDKNIDLLSQQRNLGYMVNSSNNTKVYVIDFGGEVLVIDTLTNTITNTITGLGYGTPYMVCHPTNNKLYVINNNNGTVIVINTLTNTVIGSPITVGSYPRTGMYVTYNNYIYVTNSQDDNVSVINTATDSVIATIPVGIGPDKMVYNSDLRLLYVINTGGDGVNETITVIDVVTNLVITTILTGGVGFMNTLSAIYVAYNQHLYVYNKLEGRIFVIDTTTNNIINTINVADITSDEFIYNPSNKNLYLTGGDDLYVINTVNDTILTTLNVGGSGGVYAPSNNNVYIGYGELTRVDNSNTIIEVKTLYPKAVYGIFNPSNESIYVSGQFGINIICVGDKPTSQTNITECTLEVAIINNGDNNGQILLVAQTVGGTLPFTYTWSNGATTREILVNDPKDYSVVVTDANCCGASAIYRDLQPKKACWYTMPENGVQLMVTYMCQILPSDENTQIRIDSLRVNDSDDYIGSDAPYISLNAENLVWIDANTTNYLGCDSARPAKTYTNFVTFLNALFLQYGLTGYKAQNSLIDKPYGDLLISNNASCGMYIISPINDTFSIKITTKSAAQGQTTMTYTHDTVYDENDNPWMYGLYKNIICDGINYNAATNSVIE